MLDPQFFPWCDSASPTSPLPWCPSSVVPPEAGRRMEEGLGEGEKHTPGIVKLWESPGRAGGLPRINETCRSRFHVTPLRGFLPAKGGRYLKSD